MPAASDVERQLHNAVPDKPASGNADARPHKGLAHRVIPASRGARFLCIGTVLVVLVSLLITFLAFWFSADALTIVPELRTTVIGKNVDPAQWMRDGTVIRSTSDWIIDMSVYNLNRFGMTIEDLAVTAKFATRKNRNVLFGTPTTQQSRVTIHVPAKEETDVKIALDVHWDLADHEQANALASLLILCGISASSLPAALNVPDELPDFTGYDLRGPGYLKWGMDARKVTGFLGQMTPPPGELVEGYQLHGAASGWGGGSPGQKDMIMVAVCPWLMGNRTAAPPQHIVRLANLTMQACEETGKCR